MSTITSQELDQRAADCAADSRIGWADAFQRAAARIRELEAEMEKAATTAAFRQGIIERLYDQAGALTRVGIMAARIEEHPNQGAASACLAYLDADGKQRFVRPNEPGFQIILDYLDSLPPKEPEPAYKSARDGLEAEHRATLDDMLQQATLRMSKALAGIAKLEFEQRLRAKG
jgi:plasmid stability protein